MLSFSVLLFVDQTRKNQQKTTLKNKSRQPSEMLVFKASKVKLYRVRLKSSNRPSNGYKQPIGEDQSLT